MTRFKELRRIEAAIEHRNEGELRWALAYAEMRFQDSTMKHHIKHWRSIIGRIRSARRAVQ